MSAKILANGDLQVVSTPALRIVMHQATEDRDAWTEVTVSGAPAAKQRQPSASHVAAWGRALLGRRTE